MIFDIEMFPLKPGELLVADVIVTDQGKVHLCPVRRGEGRGYLGYLGSNDYVIFLGGDEPHGCRVLTRHGVGWVTKFNLKRTQ